MTYAKLAPLVEYAPVFFHDRLLVETQDGDESRSPWPPLRHAVDDLFLPFSILCSASPIALVLRGLLFRLCRWA